MEPEPIAILIITPLLCALGILCFIRRQQAKLEKEIEWEKKKKDYKYKNWKY